MRVLRAVLAVVLCAAVMAGATAVFGQADRVLVAGKTALKQSDVDALIEFYEWAFEGHFTGEQRERFAEYTAQEFRARPAASRSTIDDIVGTFPKIRATDEETQQKARTIFVEEFLKEARQNADENSKMLVAIYESAHGGPQSDEEEKATPAPAKDEVQPEDGDEGVADLGALSGEWVWARSGSMTKTARGAYLGGNASRFTYKFYADGRVEYTGIMNTMTGGCRLQAFNAAKGRATISGDTLTIKLGPTNFSRDDTCSPSKNYKKVLPAKTEVYKVRFSNSYGQKQLCLMGEDEMCYSPA